MQGENESVREKENYCIRLPSNAFALSNAMKMSHKKGTLQNDEILQNLEKRM